MDLVENIARQEYAVADVLLRFKAAVKLSVHSCCCLCKAPVKLNPGTHQGHPQDSDGVYLTIQGILTTVIISKYHFDITVKPVF